MNSYKTASSKLIGTFKQPDLDVYTQTVLFYITACVDTVTVNKQVKVFPNQKPWINNTVQTLFKARDTAYRSGDTVRYSSASPDLKRAIGEAKRDYKRKIEDHFTDNDPRRAWQGIKHITNYKGNDPTPPNTDASLEEELNCFFAHSEAKSPSPDVRSPPASSSFPFTVQEHDVRQVFRSVNPRKATGPDRVPGKVLKECADQLSTVFTNIFNLSLAQAVIPSCLKTSTIIPIPKKPSPCSLNDYRPVALTPIVMKFFKRLVLKYIKTSLPLDLDPHEFAYRANRSTDDATTIAFHTALNHLECSGTYVRMLFVDYSSAFNTIIPDILIRKLTDLGLSSHIICHWIMDFLTNWPQQ